MNLGSDLHTEVEVVLMRERREDQHQENYFSDGDFLAHSLVIESYISSLRFLNNKYFFILMN